MAGSHGVAAFSCCLDTINDNPPCQMAMLKLGIVPMPLQSVRVNVTLCLTMMEFTDRSLVMLWVNPKFCVNAKLWCKIEQKYFKAGAAQAAAAFSTKITALRGDVKGRGVSLRSSRLLTFRLQPVSPACGRQRTPLTVRELRSSPAAFRSTSS